MGEVGLKKVFKHFGEFVAVKNVSFTAKEGELLVLVGPSGCGKTSTLRMIAGLEEITDGEIYIDDVLVNELPPRDRNIAMVFQNYALYPHMNAYDNMAFALELRHLPKEEIKQRVSEAVEILGIGDLLSRKPKELSGGERQRVAMGRAIVREPKVFLFDEPLSNLDAKLRVQMRVELNKLHERLETTMIYVTHDQHEALTFANQITVIKDGRIIQTGRPADLHAEPASPFIGYFIGSPGMNLLDCSYRDGVLNFGEFNVPLSDTVKAKLNGTGPRYQFGIRPEFILSSNRAKDGWIPWTVELVENVGSYKVITLTIDGIKIKSRAHEHMTVNAGDRVWVDFPEKHFKIFCGDERVY